MESPITVILKSITGLPVRLFFSREKRDKYFFLTLLSIIIIFSFFSCTTKDNGGAKLESSHIGRTAPEFTLNNINGNPMSLSDFKGKVVLIQFWATWCPLCRNFIRDLGPVYEQYKGKGFHILAISVDTGQDIKNKIAAFAVQHNMNYHILLGDKKTASSYSVNGIPTSFLVDKEGRIRNYYLGYQPEFSKELNKNIEELL
ncbi:MAG: TlpA family protein disulfide reductase [Nitrospirota bacterium]|nr:TlpA family protein disulfide reductase [Nitrospirota bacterium]